jgi:penicillin-binding protein 1A
VYEPKKVVAFPHFVCSLLAPLVLTALTALAVSIIYPSAFARGAYQLPSQNYRLRFTRQKVMLIGEFGEERRAFVQDRKCAPTRMKNAVLAIEDRRFYQHGGIDTKGVVACHSQQCDGH